jgi:O-antigen/teichoic acid export membrane protein
MTLVQIKRLVAHSGVYGFGLVIQAVLGVLLLPLYTHYLTRADYGALETVLAGAALLTVLLSGGMMTAFFRFHFRSGEPAWRLRVIRTSVGFTLATATLGSLLISALAVPISDALFGDPGRANLIRAGAIALWAQMNYNQIASLFRIEERPTLFVASSVANLLVSIAATVVLVVAYREGAIGVVIGNLTGTLVVCLVLFGYRRRQLAPMFDGQLLRAMLRFGLPLAASGLALWAVNFIDRFFLVVIAGQSETGVYSIAVRVSSVVALLLSAFSTAWPAFAYSIEDDREARETFSYVLTYLLYAACWLSLALGLLAPWLVRLAAPTNPSFWPASRAVALLSFATAAFAGYAVTVTATSRTGRTGFNWLVTGSGAVVNIVLNVLLIPTYGMIGAAIATVAAYGWMFIAMSWYAHRIYPVPYQWRRIALIAAVSVGLTVGGSALPRSLPVALVLVVAFPFALAVFAFYRPAELRTLRRVVLLGR